MHRILRSADVQSGIMFIALALFALWLAAGLRTGTAMRMGPGYLPGLLGYILLALGFLTLLVGVLRPDTAADRWYLRPILAVLAALLVFAFGIEALGLFATIALVVLVASLATRDSRPIEVILVALALGAFSTGLFVKALGLPIPPWPQFLVS